MVDVKCSTRIGKLHKVWPLPILPEGVAQGPFGNDRVAHLVGRLYFLYAPPAIQEAADQLRRFGLSAQVDELQRTMNRAAEAAAEEAVPVFAASIRRMSPSDVLAVFNGGDDAATQYLRRTAEVNCASVIVPS